MSNNAFDALIHALLDGNQSAAVAEAANLNVAGIEKERIITGGIEAAMVKLDRKCTVEQFNLLEIMLAGRAVTGVMKMLYPDAPPAPTRETVVLASLEGDVHDLGKNIVKTVLLAKGYRVVDCGKDCPLERLIDTVETEGAEIICISGLITSVMPQVRRIAPLLRQRGLTGILVLAGGAALKQASAQALSVDFVADSVFDGVRYLESSAGKAQ